MNRWESNRDILRRVESKVDALRQEVRRFRQDEAMEDIGEYLMNQEVLDKIREASTVSASTNLAIREVLLLLKAGQSDPAKIEEAKQLLEAMRADDAALLTENTPAAHEPPFTPSGQ